ncbi:ECF-type sigma factor [Luteolibacter flavescens]|uniref:ECF-type sigma factor n=1 Tax=Luteolibacter flavescens TaxID=1859460 RepID=A0ABT3FQJ9_9BACT|nr:ECF-type sigma factor [Luteolibacter flavescens]MCW1885250.1 ECF-type sigma factor [Luteolibacter flavescens]
MNADHPDNDDVWKASQQDRLVPVVYEELRRMAAIKMKNERQGHTLQPTALVHEAWLRLRGTGDGGWENRAHFMGAAAQAMRRILVENARRKSATKRQQPVRLPGLPDFNDGSVSGPEDHVLVIHESLRVLEREDADSANLVILKFFSGLESLEIARMTGTSVRSVERRWTMAKARLYQIIREGEYEQTGGLT